MQPLTRLLSRSSSLSRALRARLVEAVGLSGPAPSWALMRAAYCSEVAAYLARNMSPACYAADAPPLADGPLVIFDGPDYIPARFTVAMPYGQEALCVTVEQGGRTQRVTVEDPDCLSLLVVRLHDVLSTESYA